MTGHRWIRSRFSPRAVILGYHRVSDDIWDPYCLNSSPTNFAEQLSVIRDVANPVRLSELAKGLRDGSLPPRSVVVTLDDGYRDNLTAAKPLLHEHEIPATVFIVTGYLGQEFWWDQLARSVTPEVRLPGKLKLEGNRWIVEEGQSPEDRERWLATLHGPLAELPAEERSRLIGELRSIVGTPSNAGAEARSMDESELCNLAEGPLVEIGSHSETHPFLTDLPEREQRREIEESKQALEGLLSWPVVHFSYPHGSVSEVTRRLVAEAGYSCGCRSGADVVRPGSDPFALPRFWPPNCGGAEFAAWLRRWI
jgi:peptidoglycan/xylan/chitin deacetylase (PgdA/CDA1 family)